MKRQLKRLLQNDALLLAALLILAVIAIPLYESSQAGQKHEGSPKTLIIFAEALPYYVVSPNLDSFPTLKSLCAEGACFSMKPAAPTFTTMQNYVLKTGKEPFEANYAYNFIINATALQQNSCAFIGEITELARQEQGDLFSEIASNYEFTYYSVPTGEDRYSRDSFPEIPELLSENDVVYTYVTDTDSHYTNLTYTNGSSAIVAQFKEFDRELGELITGLKREGLYDQTSIILYGDHGMAAVKQLEYLPEILEELKSYADMSNLCYWNDAGTSLRFWILPKAGNKEEIRANLSDYFLAKAECFYVVNETMLKENALLFPSPEERLLSFGDVHIGVRPGCKVNTQRASGGMEKGFAEQQNRVDSYISMHGYIDSSHPSMQAFVLVRSSKSFATDAAPSNFTVKDLHKLVKSAVFGEERT